MENKKVIIFKYCVNPDCLWQGETDADECPKCGEALRVAK